MRPLTEQERREICERIRISRPDIVWVGLGLRKQENWIAENIDEIGAPWMAGVGAAFDYHAGTVPWAPAPIRAVGLEWLFRLIIQPRLRAKRYWWSFVWLVQTFLKGLLTGQFRHPALRLEPPPGWKSASAGGSSRCSGRSV
jgi:N-acetylglucosaminyldiphosphoundecaprenol N-acetyl-beta-D-mannosaminyltransferase